MKPSERTGLSVARIVWIALAVLALAGRAVELTVVLVIVALMVMKPF